MFGHRRCTNNALYPDVVGYVENKLNSLGTEKVNFFSVHCILHQEALCSKSLQMREFKGKGNGFKGKGNGKPLLSKKKDPTQKKRFSFVCRF